MRVELELGKLEYKRRREGGSQGGKARVHEVCVLAPRENDGMERGPTTRKRQNKRRAQSETRKDRERGVKIWLTVPRAGGWARGKVRKKGGKKEEKKKLNQAHNKYPAAVHEYGQHDIRNYEGYYVRH
jgi:hypothetical protein